MLKIILLGAIQGLTEFFPVSSSGHLVIAQHFLNVTGNVVTLDISLHIGTTAALISYFWRDILKVLKNKKIIFQIVLVTLATGVVGIPLKKVFESLFTSANHVAICLMINGVILISTMFWKNKDRYPNNVDSLLMGLAQGLAITPGISRSGSTITMLLARGVKREEAFRFSFIASIPAIIGAFLLEARHATGPAMPFSPELILCGIAVSYIFGLLSLQFLNRIIKNNKFHVFGFYCITLGLTLFIFLPK